MKRMAPREAPMKAKTGRITAAKTRTAAPRAARRKTAKGAMPKARGLIAKVAKAIGVKTAKRSMRARRQAV